MTTARLNEADKTRNEAAIRAAMERILAGNLPPGGKPELKTLAAMAGITRTGFYSKKNRDSTPRPGPYQPPRRRIRAAAAGTPRCRRDRRPPGPCRSNG